jgi:hypothetical protein
MVLSNLHLEPGSYSNFLYNIRHRSFKNASAFFIANSVNVLNLHIIDLARKYYTHLQREIEKEEEREKEWKNSH